MEENSNIKDKVKEAEEELYTAQEKLSILETLYQGAEREIEDLKRKLTIEKE